MKRDFFGEKGVDNATTTLQLSSRQMNCFISGNRIREINEQSCYKMATDNSTVQ